MATEVFPGITVAPSIVHGRPVIAGTRVPVEVVLGELAGGSSFDEIRDDYHLIDEQIRAALAYAARMLSARLSMPTSRAPRVDTMSIERIHVAFNSLTSAPVGLVKYLQEDGRPPLREGERVVLYDADGLEVEATVVPFVTTRGERVLLAAPDEATWRDTVPQEIPLPPVEAR